MAHSTAVPNRPTCLALDWESEGCDPPSTPKAVGGQQPFALRDGYGPDLMAAGGQIPMAADTRGYSAPRGHARR
jgi:hypothetical protein